MASTRKPRTFLPGWGRFAGEQGFPFPGNVEVSSGLLLTGTLFIPIFFAGIALMIKSPNLLRKRLNAKGGAR